MQPLLCYYLANNKNKTVETILKGKLYVNETQSNNEEFEKKIGNCDTVISMYHEYNTIKQ